MQSYGLTKKKAKASIADVDDALDKNTSALMDIVTAMVNSVNGHLRDNESALDYVVNRLVNSINGHLKRNFGILKPVGNTLVDHVNGYIAQNDAILGAAAANPDIASYLRASEGAHGYQLKTPTAPPEAPAAPPPAIAVRGAPQIYTVVADHAARTVQAVPGTPDSWPANGFSLPPQYAVVGSVHGDPDAVAAHLAANVDAYLRS